MKTLITVMLMIAVGFTSYGFGQLGQRNADIKATTDIMFGLMLACDRDNEFAIGDIKYACLRQKGL